jgi:hypothetical protein
MDVSKAKTLSVTHTQESKIDLWHQRLGHISPKATKKLTEAVSSMEISGSTQGQLPGEVTCLPCLAGKIHESFNNKSTDTRATQPLERIHADISGIKPLSTRGYRYFLLLVDDFTRHCWVYLLKSKETHESVTIFKQFKALAEKEIGKQIKVFRSDNSKGEFGPKL